MEINSHDSISLLLLHSQHAHVQAARLRGGHAPGEGNYTIAKEAGYTLVLVCDITGSTMRASSKVKHLCKQCRRLEHKR